MSYEEFQKAVVKYFGGGSKFKNETDQAAEINGERIPSFSARVEVNDGKFRKIYLNRRRSDDFNAFPERFQKGERLTASSFKTGSKITTGDEAIRLLAISLLGRTEAEEIRSSQGGVQEQEEVA
ncbi:MAG: hypothetical protein HQ536_03625 [Parcubacteria group bacterium]|nr:hypothetical protein [Parcubacteria group bacterium]